MDKFMTKKLALTAVLLGVALLTLTGCFGKSSRRFIDGKAAELSKVYPTENLEDLFEKFPDGFQIISTESRQETEDSPSISFEITLNGSPYNKEITGELVKRSATTDSKGHLHEEVLVQEKVYYKNGSLHLSSNSDEKIMNLKHSKLLVQLFTISKEELKKLKVKQKSYSSETGSATITYQLNNKMVEQYMGLNGGNDLDMSVNIFYETIHKNDFGYSLEFRDKNDYYYSYYSEVILEKKNEEE
ncbi:hypothetical protein QM458_07435 [Streptococcus infantis]|uniref:hypothetical protein n=1 Tax=Streptococcus infantis TaxID=68892 RepID=UPI0039C1B11A